MVRNADSIHALGMTEALLHHLGRARAAGMDQQLRAADRGAIRRGMREG